MLCLIGIGLRDANDITLKGLEHIKKADVIYLEGYTSLMQCSVDDLSTVYGKKVTPLGRPEIESSFILDEAEKKKVALLIIGDPFAATTHSSLVMEARDRGIFVEIVHNASILSAVGETGLSLYKFGRVISLLFGALPESVYDALCANQKCGLHTLCLLDIKVDENRFMTVNEGIRALLALEEKCKKNLLSSVMLALGIARLGGNGQVIKAGTFTELEKVDFGPPPHCIIIPASERHFIEEGWISHWRKYTSGSN